MILNFNCQENEHTRKLECTIMESSNAKMVGIGPSTYIIIVPNLLQELIRVEVSEYIDSANMIRDL